MRYALITVQNGGISQVARERMLREIEGEQGRRLVEKGGR
jgi:hypothetical protein